MDQPSKKSNAARIGISWPEVFIDEFELIMAPRSYPNRSDLISTMLGERFVRRQ